MVFVWAPLRTVPRILSRAFTYSVSLRSTSVKPHASSKPRLDLDPSYRALFNDIDISMKKGKMDAESVHRELEIVYDGPVPTNLELSTQEWSPFDEAVESDFQEEYDNREHRKSPAALFGSNQVSMVVLPSELQTAIEMLISEGGQKSTLHSDSMRLFKSPDSRDGEDAWDTQYDTRYSSRKQAAKHAIRDGTAFATVALPAHYSAIAAVFHHLKVRLDPEWEVEKIIDWGTGTGSGLWASLYSFNGKDVESGEEIRDKSIVATAIKSYTGIDKREGLIAIGKKLLSNVPDGALNIKWKKSYRPEDQVLQEEGPKTIALSAFMLTAQPHSLAQKTLVQEMWDSGAHTIILIDHNTREGFEAIANAREYILGLGKAEVEEPETAPLNIRGAHVVAPCPHDHACPLLHSGGASLVCGFEQRIQRPSFVRRTKHSGIGHEDIGYSYVIIRRGPRPTPTGTSVGRVGGIGKREEKTKPLGVPIKELKVLTTEDILETVVEESATIGSALEIEPILEPSDLHAQLRREAYQWPRLVFRPLKKSGHIILDSCTAEGKIMRLTIPKSQGKQPFYDARKSNWGDIFPHAPKNRPLERYQPKKTHGKGQPPSTGSDIGKRRDSFKDRERPVTKKWRNMFRTKRKSRDGTLRVLEEIKFGRIEMNDCGVF
ncbi:mitochondrial small ribosomal subunit Rsm22-domain-containing protein [Gymnopilus junonius]|uniref:Mitochondrial small ribosomal subunit Rsm22-domain-containing protein n=1 Tax=Gymnopilus junonius TaxID=109634 RepID=A0A9P5NZP9_GYMJU|nr:mitochondrial small ribosomal subunit Rsm22-domain-containing protein [Gymnopilus junonius]